MGDKLYRQLAPWLQVAYPQFERNRQAELDRDLGAAVRQTVESRGVYGLRNMATYQRFPSRAAPVVANLLDAIADQLEAEEGSGG